MIALTEWLGREGGLLLAWWALVSLAGLAVWPLCVRWLGGLADKGYTLARSLGLLLVAFVFWLLASLGLLENTAGSMILAWGLVASLAWFVLRRDLNLGQFWRQNKGMILFSEALFLLLFVGWAIVRAHHPDTSTTEKPMEMAFISGIMRSEAFPPNDPWLAGYSISYYYFGYVMVAMLSTLSGASSGLGFSLAVALWFALSGLNAFGVVYNLVRARGTWVRQSAAFGAGLLAAGLLIFISNWQFPLVELPYQAHSGDQNYYNFWQVQGRENAPVGQAGWRDPQSWDYWWWFRASRVLSDRWLSGQPMPNWWAQPISEFPSFSFLLADNHPHVLALPFAVLALGMALNIVMLGRAPGREEILLYGLMVGGLVFLNTWDGPIYLAVLAGAEALRRLHTRGRLDALDWWGVASFSLSLLGIGLLAYLPFFIGFRSQAAGIMPNPVTPTYFPQFLLMFAPFILLSGAFLLTEWWRGARTGRMNWRAGWATVGGLLLILILLMVVLLALAEVVPILRNYVYDTIMREGGWGANLDLILQRRLEYAPTTLVLLATMLVVVARLFPRRLPDDEDDSARAQLYPVASGFALLLLGVGAGLVLIPEFIYLRDNFGTRINTVFKFYYQAWIVLALASAYGAHSLLTDPEEQPASVLRVTYVGVLALVLSLGSLYPIFGIHNRTQVEVFQVRGYAQRIASLNLLEGQRLLAQDGQWAEEGAPLIVNADGRPALLAPQAGQVALRDGALWLRAPLSLDGARHMPLTADDYAAVRCLDSLVRGSQVVVAEAVRDAYASHYGRVASITGLPILMGWENHQRQWRGSVYGELAGTRAQDVNRLYSDLRWDAVQDIINRYRIDYVFYGQTERNQYGSSGEEKFRENARVVCAFGESRVYEVSNAVRAQ
ncbi:MAG: DUF2298 domain-containing protein [Anaerolineae bacterium]|nr:DUF2298 domain-containing protein [Anaerolineae bacterium]MDW8171497.1 DUF2298 domain-containing protein [Anaerolineae bacterium]